jgi:NADPH:quinone reductase-like Zn-dependent oxidoreductase
MPEYIRPGGTLVCVITLITGVEAFDQDAAAARGVRVIDDIGNSMTVDPAMIQVAPFRTLLAAINGGKIRVPPYEIMPLSAAAEAQERVAEGHVRGKILLKVAEL